MVLWGKRKRWEKLHFEIFGLTDYDLSTSSLISSNLNILVSTHPIGKLKTVLESLRSGEDMVKNQFWYFECFTSEILVTLHLPRGETMSPGPRRNFRNMGFHFSTPIFHFLSKPEPNPKLVAYSMITHTWNRKTHFDKTSKKSLRQNSKTKFSLSKLNFWKLPCSSRH